MFVLQLFVVCHWLQLENLSVKIEMSFVSAALHIEASLIAFIFWLVSLKCLKPAPVIISLP
jgi:hypothetical protein